MGYKNYKNFSKQISVLNEYCFVNKNILNIDINNKTCFIILGHEINKNSFKLSISGEERCKVLAKKIQEIKNNNYIVIFMGLGRNELMGKCNLTISECMFKHFSENFFTPEYYFLEKRSLDTVGDAIYSANLLELINFKQKILIITSDWHLKRTEIVFKKIYGLKFKPYFLCSNELKNIKEDQKNSILKHEEKSIQLFNRTFRNFDNKKNNSIEYLKENHLLYKPT